MKKLIVLLFLITALPLSVSAANQNVALHKPYALVTPAAAGYSDDGGELTDGVYAERIQSGAKSYYYKSDAYVGFSADDADEGDFVIICDLGEIMHDLCLFEVSLLNETDMGVYIPRTVTVAVSDEYDGAYRDVGVYLSNEPYTSGISQTVIATVTPPGDISGRYVRFTLSGVSDGGWVFTDEISVYSASEASEAESTLDTMADDAGHTEAAKKDSNLLIWIIIGVAFGLVVFTVLRDKPGGID